MRVVLVIILAVIMWFCRIWVHRTRHIFVF